MPQWDDTFQAKVIWRADMSFDSENISSEPFFRDPRWKRYTRAMNSAWIPCMKFVANENKETRDCIAPGSSNRQKFPSKPFPSAKR